MFRGREMQHPDLGKKILDRVAESVAHLARMEVVPKLDGRNMIMVLAPDKKARAAWEAQKVKDGEELGLSPDGDSAEPAASANGSAATAQRTPAPAASTTATEATTATPPAGPSDG
jgi:translation initiation factor IF-3